MNEQIAFNLYSYLIIGFIGNSIIAWEFGRKGWARVGLEGAKNRKLTFALFLFIFMVIWQMVRKLSSPLSDWHSLWLLGWALSVYLIARLTIPRSMRIYSRAKFLHETTYTGDWRKSEPEIPVDQLRVNWRLIKAETLYLKALKIQEDLEKTAVLDSEINFHRENMLVTFSQLALLYLQQRRYEEVSAYADNGKALCDKISNDNEALQSYSNILFWLAEAYHMQGKTDSAKEVYEESMNIDRKAGAFKDAEVTRKRMAEIGIIVSYGE
jgi:tetratricopeptide (TPR) repeat protein